MMKPITFLALAALLLVCIFHTTDALGTGAPICSLDSLNNPPWLLAPTGMRRNEDQALPNPAGWSLLVSTDATTQSTQYFPSLTYQINVRNTDANKKFRGLLLWSKKPNTTPSQYTGNFPDLEAGLLTLFKVPNSAVTLGGFTSQTAECSSTFSVLTHVSNVPKTQEQGIFNWTAPANGTGTVEVRAFLVEDCGSGGGNCSGIHYLLDAVQLSEFATPSPVIDDSESEMCGKGCVGGIAAMGVVLLGIMVVILMKVTGKSSTPAQSSRPQRME